MPPLIVVKNELERSFLQVAPVLIPVVYLLRAGVEYLDQGGLPATLLDTSRLLSELAFLLALIVAKTLFTELPYSLKQLFASAVLTPRSSQPADASAQFIQTLSRQLNQPRRYWLSAIALTLIVMYYASTYNISALANRSVWGVWAQLLTVGPILVYTYFTGILLWKFFVISQHLQTLPDCFQLTPQFGHPDQAGGLLPIGLICLNLVYLPVVPAIASAGVLVMGYTPWVVLGRANYGFIFGVLVFSTINSLIALRPLFKFHQAMVEQRDAALVRLQQLSAQIVQLKQAFIQASTTADVEGLSTCKTHIELCEAFYRAHQQVNTWPVNRKVLVELWATQTFLASQLVAAWNLVTQFVGS